MKSGNGSVTPRISFQTLVMLSLAAPNSQVLTFGRSVALLARRTVRGKKLNITQLSPSSAPER
jgi:hypothetical protein